MINVIFYISSGKKTSFIFLYHLSKFAQLFIQRSTLHNSDKPSSVIDLNHMASFNWRAVAVTYTVRDKFCNNE